MRALVVGSVVVALASSEAAADYKLDVDRAARGLKQTPPRPGVDQAPPASGKRPAWCGPLPAEPLLGGMTGYLDSYYQHPTKLYELVAAAQALCKNDTTHPVIKRATQEIVQLWMNAFGLGVADAVESLLFRRFQACVAVDGDPEAALEMLRIEDPIRVVRGPLPGHRPRRPDRSRRHPA
jgi:hypothetical protein